MSRCSCQSLTNPQTKSNNLSQSRGWDMLCVAGLTGRKDGQPFCRSGAVVARSVHTRKAGSSNLPSATRDCGSLPQPDRKVGTVTAGRGLHKIPDQRVAGGNAASTCFYLEPEANTASQGAVSLTVALAKHPPLDNHTKSCILYAYLPSVWEVAQSPPFYPRPGAR